MHFFYTTAGSRERVLAVSGGRAALQVGHRGVQAAARGGVKLPAHITWLLITLHFRAFAFVYVNVDYVCSGVPIQAGNVLIKSFMLRRHIQRCVFNN